MARINIWIQDNIKTRIDAYNEANEYLKLNVSKIAQDAITATLSELENMDKKNKFCRCCGALKPIDDFTKSVNSKDGYGIYCKTCRSIKSSKGAFGGNRQKTIDKTGGKCAVCGDKFDVVHHIVPRHEGGTDELDNLIPLCNRCHSYAHDGNYFNNNGINPEIKTVLQKRISEINSEINA